MGVDTGKKKSGRARLQQGERVRGEIASTKGQEAFITIDHHSVWDWRAQQFWKLVSSLFRKQRSPEGSIRLHSSPSLSWCLGRATVLEARLLHSELVSYSFQREFGANFLSVQKATLGTGSRGPKDSVRASLSWCLELASPRFWRHGGSRGPRDPRPAFTLMVFGTGEPTVLEAKLLHSELVSYSFRRLESGNVEI